MLCFVSIIWYYIASMISVKPEDDLPEVGDTDVRCDVRV